MGQLSAKQQRLFTRMEGSEARGNIYQTVQNVTRFIGPRATLESTANEALSNQPTMKAFETMLDGLLLEFEKRHVVIPLEHLPPRPADLVLIRMFGDVLPEGPARVTTLRGFLHIHFTLQEVLSDLDLLRKSTMVTQWRTQVDDGAHGNAQSFGFEEGREEECPICMDRPIDTVLSCSHGICKVCEMEWLVGEGRGTCPMCRAREKEGDDWVLNGKDVFLSVDQEELRTRLSNNVHAIYEFLLSLPCWKECAETLGIPFEPEEESIYDGIGNWLRGELAYKRDERHDFDWGRCPRCTSVIRVPSTSETGTRLTCPGCRTLWPVEVLLAI